MILGERRRANPAIGALVRDRRDQLALTQPQLSARSGVSVSMIKKIEKGERTPGAAALGKLSTVFGRDFAFKALYLLSVQEERG